MPLQLNSLYIFLKCCFAHQNVSFQGNHLSVWQGILTELKNLFNKFNMLHSIIIKLLFLKWCWKKFFDRQTRVFLGFEFSS